MTDFPDDETATAVALQTGALGNIRTRTMKAFDGGEADTSTVDEPGNSTY